MSSSKNKQPKKCRSNTSLTTNNAESTSIQDLPNELLFAIFNHLPSEEILLTIPRVCQRWSDLHDDACLYRHLVFRGNNPDTSVAVQLITMATGLKSLRMRYRKDTNEILRQMTICNPRLETLELRACQGSTSRFLVSAFSLQSVIKNCPKLRSLSLRDTYCISLQFYSDIGDCLPLLTSVDLGPLCNQSALLKNADKFRELWYLRMFSSVSDNTVTRYCGKNSGSLITVKLECSECTDASLTALGTCRLLKTLCLEMAKEITDRGIMEISKLPNLEKLHISEAGKVTSECWIRFFQKPHIKRIKKLFLLRCDKMNDDVAIAIAKNLPDLQIFYMV